MLFPCADCGGPTKMYWVREDVWTAAGMPYEGDLCFPCLETRLGRSLTGSDFPEQYRRVPNVWVE